MRFAIAVVLLALTSAACTHGATKRNANGRPTPREVERGVRYGIIFGITPDESGKLVGFRFDRSIDPRTRSNADFTPSSAYVASARAVLANGNWRVVKKDDGTIAEVYIHCLYSTALPDEAICDAKFAPAAGAAPLAFSERLSDCDGRWVVLPAPAGKDAFLFGFVYVDPSAGFTLDVGGLLKVDARGEFHRVPDSGREKARFMIRLDARNNGPAALLPTAAISQLGLEELPAFVRFYTDTSDPVTHRVRWGSHLNHVGDSRRALTYLEPAYAEKPDANGLAFELAYAYNALGRNADALDVLKKAVARDPDDLLLGVELAFSYLSSGTLEAAIDLYLKLIPRCDEKHMLQKSEMAYNLSRAYERSGNEANARKWLADAKAWAPEGSPLHEALDR